MFGSAGSHGMGAPPQAIQSMMRHSSITLTMDQDGHLFPGEQARVIERLGTLFKSFNPAKLPNHLKYGSQQSPHDSVRTDVTVCERLGSNSGIADDQNAWGIANLCDSVQPASLQCGNTPGGIRTPDRRIRNALLGFGLVSDTSLMLQNKGFSDDRFCGGFSHLTKSGYSFQKCTHLLFHRAAMRTAAGRTT